MQVRNDLGPLGSLGHFLLCVRRILRIDGPDGYSDTLVTAGTLACYRPARRAASVDPSVVFRDDDLESGLHVSDPGCAGVAAICRSLPHPAKATSKIVRKSARSRSLEGALNLRVLGSIPRRLTTNFIDHSGICLNRKNPRRLRGGCGRVRRVQQIHRPLRRIRNVVRVHAKGDRCIGVSELLAHVRDVASHLEEVRGEAVTLMPRAIMPSP